MDTAVEERVDRVEIALERFIYEMKEFKDEMREFRIESERDRKSLHNEMREFKDEMKEFKDEMKEFKDEMKEFKDEMKAENIRMNKRWGEISNKLGTLVEDIVAPSIPRIAKERFGIEVDDLFVRRKKRVKGIAVPVKEWDAIALSSDVVFLNYTKSTLRSSDIDEFLGDIKIFRDYFPEYKEKGIIGVLASLYVDDSVLRYAEGKGLLVLGIGEEMMEIKNSKDFEPVRF